VRSDPRFNVTVVCVPAERIIAVPLPDSTNSHCSERGCSLRIPASLTPFGARVIIAAWAPRVEAITSNLPRDLDVKLCFMLLAQNLPVPSRKAIYCAHNDLWEASLTPINPANCNTPSASEGPPTILFIAQASIVRCSKSIARPKLRKNTPARIERAQSRSI
jgi:hypothetical protein